MKINFSSTFEKSLKKRYKGNSVINKKINNALKSFTEIISKSNDLEHDKESLDLLHSKLDFHKLTKQHLNYVGCYEFKAADNVCLITQINKEDVTLLDIGSHGDLKISNNIFSSYSIEKAFKDLNEQDSEKIRNKKLLNEFFNELLEEGGVNEEDYYPITEEQITVKNGLQKILIELQNEAEEDLNEEFNDSQSLEKHFNKHCMGGNMWAHPNGKKQSKESNVRYDFMKLEEYENYERELLTKCKQSVTFEVKDTTIDEIKKILKELKEDNKVVWVPLTLGFLDNNNQPAQFYFRSFANSVTTNFAFVHTIDFMVVTSAGKTLTLYPLAYSKLENKLNKLFGIGAN